MQKLNNLLNKFFEFLNNKYSLNTIRAYKKDLEIPVNLSWEEINKPSKDFWIKYLSNASVSVKLRKVAAWKSFFKFCTQRGETITSGLLLFSIRNNPKKIFKIPDLDIIHNYLQYIPNTWIEKRNYALILLMYSTGIRASEVILISYKEEKFIRIRGKGQKYRDIPVLDIVKDALISYLESCPYDTERFINHKGNPLNYREIYYIIQQTPWRTPHQLRRTAATYLSRAGMNIQSLKILLGHSMLDTTYNYVSCDYQYLQDLYNQAIKE